jgi:hypothetical protein
MPFTISHIAAVLPFSRLLARWRLLSATIIGSMVPDFGFLMPWRPPRAETHMALSLFTFCLPVGLMTFWLFQQLLKEPVMAVLPDSAYARWRHYAAPADIGSIKQWLLAGCGILVGAITHLVWDGFTHEGARGVRMIPILDDSTVDIAGHHLVGMRLLQDGSSLVGIMLVFAIVGYALRRGGREDIPARPLAARERHLWILSYVMTAILLAALFLAVRHPWGSDKSLSLLIGNGAIAALRGFATALVVVSLCLTRRLRASP